MFQRALPEVNGLGVTTPHARLDQIAPAGDVLGVALAHDDHRHRVRDEAVRGVLVPARRDEAGLDELFDVGFQREVDDVGVQAVGHRAALFAGGAEGLAEAHALAFGWWPGRRGSAFRRRPAASSRRRAASSCLLELEEEPQAVRPNAAASRERPGRQSVRLRIVTFYIGNTKSMRIGLRGKLA